VDRFQVVGFESHDYLAYVISDLDAQQNLQLAANLAPTLREYLAHAHPSGCCASFNGNCVCLVWNQTMIKVQGLTKRYARTIAVDNISFEVEKGQIVGFLGPNGAGKTTTMRVLTCFLPPTAGTANVAGFDVLENPLEVKKRIGYLPETPPLYPEMEVDEYLTFVGRLKGISSADVERRVGEGHGACALGDVRTS
jgi:ABC-type glutathione transport system ATPase component